MQLINVPALKDNYIWLLATARRRAVIVDPGEATPVISQLRALSLAPLAILLTHHHDDHTRGVKELTAAYPEVRVYGPQETLIKGATQRVQESSVFATDELLWHVIALPGHTLGHVAYYLPQTTPDPPYLFCGDTLFSAGCGRLFEGTHQQMYHSLQRLAALPESTQVCCGHEYTLENLRFARHVDNENKILAAYEQKILQLRTNNQPSLPTSLQMEKAINPFLRCHHDALQRALPRWVGAPLPLSPLQTFAELRCWKDRF